MNSLLKPQKLWYRLHSSKSCLTNLSNEIKTASNASVNKELIRIGKLAGITKHFSFHTARHTNATLLIYKGVQLSTVQKLLGHRNIKTTQVYGEVLPQTIIKELKKCKF